MSWEKARHARGAQGAERWVSILCAATGRVPATSRRQPCARGSITGLAPAGATR